MRYRFLGEHRAVDLLFDEETFDIVVRPGKRLKIQSAYPNLCIVNLSGFLSSNDLDPEDMIGRYSIAREPSGGFRVLFGTRLAPSRKSLHQARLCIPVGKKLKATIDEVRKDMSMAEFVRRSITAYLSEEYAEAWNRYLTEDDLHPHE